MERQNHVHRKVTQSPESSSVLAMLALLVLALVAKDRVRECRVALALLVLTYFGQVLQRRWTLDPVVLSSASILDEKDELSLIPGSSVVENRSYHRKCYSLLPKPSAAFL